MSGGRRIAYEERYDTLLPGELALVSPHTGTMAAARPPSLGCRDRPSDPRRRLAEDAHPWIESAPRGAVVVAILRRIAYDLTTLFRSVSQRADANRQLPWRSLLRDVYLTLVATTAAELAGMRRPLIPPVPD